MPIDTVYRGFSEVVFGCTAVYLKWNCTGFIAVVLLGLLVSSVKVRSAAKCGELQYMYMYVNYCGSQIAFLWHL